MDFPADIEGGPFGGLSPWDAGSVWNNTYAGGFASRPWQSANNAVIAEVTDCDDALIDRAIDAAARAFPAWRRTLAPERGKQLRALGERMLADEARLAELCTREMGKPLKESAAEVKYAASFLAPFAIASSTSAVTLPTALSSINGPISTPASLPRPTLSFFTASTSFAVNASATLASTMNRFAATHD